jgi:hypothetical protein
MIHGRIRIHDRTSFEVKLNYLLEGRQPRYDIEAYLFIPRSLGINRDTYRKHAFYRDARSWLRFKTPTVPLRRLSSVDGSLAILSKTARRLSDKPTETRTRDFAHELKLFTCIFRASLRDHVRFTARQRVQADAEPLITQYREQVGATLATFRSLRNTVNVPGVPAGVVQTFQHADEYLSLVARDATLKLFRVVRHARSWDLAPHWGDDLLALIRAERQYRVEHEFPSIPEMEGDNEVFAFRRSVLKKFFSSVLYLDTSVRRPGKVAEQVVFGVAAGVAMVFATAIAFYSQSRWGTMSLPFFMALVVSYIFKDRIKDSMKVVLASRTKRRLLDHKIRLHAGPDRLVGTVGEGFSFLTDRTVPQEVQHLRNRDHLTEIENDDMGEEIILYRKRVHLDTTNVECLGSDTPVEGVTDVTRINIHRYLERMDDPRQSLYVVDAEDYRKVKARRVYHMQLVLKYHLIDEVRLKRYRLVLDKEGLLRIEKVSEESIEP